jgi:hypothetical protein
VIAHKSSIWGDAIMSELAAAIAKLDAVKSHNPNRDPTKHHLAQREMNKDRIEFAQLIGEIARTWEQDPKLNADPALKADFGSRFAETRHTLSRHQAAWTAERMTAEPKEYQASVMNTGKTLSEFLAWAKLKV